MIEKAPVVYLAEDDDELRALFIDGLRSAGYQVRAASHGHEMLRLLTSATRGEGPLPDVFVLDIRMPHADGLTVLDVVRLRGFDAPVLMLTGFGDPVLCDRATRGGAAAVLEKPVALDDLVDVVDVLLTTQPKRERLRGDEEPVTVRPPAAVGAS